MPIPVLRFGRENLPLSWSIHRTLAPLVERCSALASVYTCCRRFSRDFVDIVHAACGDTPRLIDNRAGARIDDSGARVRLDRPMRMVVMRIRSAVARGAVVRIHICHGRSRKYNFWRACSPTSRAIRRRRHYHNLQRFWQWRSSATRPIKLASSYGISLISAPSPVDPASIERQHGPRDFAGFHRAEGFVDVAETAALGDHRIEVEPALAIEIEV